MKVLPLHCKQLDLGVAWMTTSVPSPVGDVKIVALDTQIGGIFFYYLAQFKKKIPRQCKYFDFSLQIETTDNF